MCPLAHWAFVPNVFVDISATLDGKLEAVRLYGDTFQSEVKPYPHPRSIDAVRAHARYFGSAAGMLAAEAFMLIRHYMGG